jgi:hypothetical protein
VSSAASGGTQGAVVRSGDPNSAPVSGVASGLNDPRSRDRGGRPVTGAAVARAPISGTAPLIYYNYYPWYGSGFNWYYGNYGYNPYFAPYPTWAWGFYGVWYNPFDPYGFGYSPYAPWYGDPSGYGDPYGYGGGGAYGAGGGSSNDKGYSSSLSTRPERPEITGSVRLRVNPNQAKVYIDGTLMGTVDQFDGLTGHLATAAGAHEFEFRADGYRSTTVTVDVEANKTITVRASLDKSKN